MLFARRRATKFDLLFNFTASLLFGAPENSTLKSIKTLADPTAPPKRPPPAKKLKSNGQEWAVNWTTMNELLGPIGVTAKGGLKLV